jgi:predicted RNA binding protein YcfA (HicA-like mRNA interferase family)
MLRDSRDIVRRLKKEGFELVSVRGSHHKFRHPVGRQIVIVVHPRKDTPIGTATEIYKQAGWPKD